MIGSTSQFYVKKEEKKQFDWLIFVELLIHYFKIHNLYIKLFNLAKCNG